ncbi:MAG: glucose-6-phosphate dehydrogenase assembly protein OpcA [Minicystis sp.]
MSSSGAVSEAVSKVEAELNSFWSSEGEGGEAKARAATMNFVAVGAPNHAEALRQEVSALAETRAGRVFLMTLDGRLAPWEVVPDVSAVCHKDGDNVVCYDRIELSFGAMAAGRAGSVLKALAISEVPTIVEAGHGAPSVLIDPLLKGCDRIIVDSADAGVARVAEIARKSELPIGDRAFVRSFSWRELIARFFDDSRDALRAIRSIAVERTVQGKNDPAALLLGWLGSRLGWRFESAGSAVDLRGNAISIDARIVQPAEGQSGGDVLSVRIVTELGGQPFELACVRNPGEARTVCWKRSGALTGQHDHAIGFRDEAWVLLKCIDATAGDRVYREAILAAADWSRR